MLHEKLVLAHVVWMDAYQGDAETVKNVGHRFAQASHLDENSGEIFNFSPVSGCCYGYVPRLKRDRITGERELKVMNINRLGASSDETFLEGVTVVWTATPDRGKDRLVVGWYNNATAFRIPKEGLDPKRPNERFYFSAQSDNCYLIPAELRFCPIPLSRNTIDKDGPGTDALYYPGKRVANIVRKYIRTAPAQSISKPKAPKSTKPSEPPRRPATKSPRQPDIETRLAVEKAAMDKVKQVLTCGKWKFKDVSDRYVGWDIFASQNGPQTRNMRIEVKGLSGLIATVELTPNEYEKLGYDAEKKTQDRYVVAIVTDALSPETMTLQCFSLKGGVWRPFDIERGLHITDSDLHLVVTPIMGARCSVVLLPRG